MGDFISDYSKGRVGERYNNVDSGSPANSRLIIILLAASGLEADAVLAARATLGSVVTAGTTREATNTGYYRKILTSSDIAMPAPDTTNHRLDLDIPVDPVWGTGSTGPANDGTGPIGKLMVGYMPDITVGLTGTTGANVIVPVSFHDFPITPSGAPLTAQINAAGFARAQGAGGGV